jgi:FixJ family two-component response regulator
LCTRLLASPQALVERSRIILAAAAGESNQEIADDLNLPEVTVGKWRRRFAHYRYNGLETCFATAEQAFIKTPQMRLATQGH